MKLSQSRRGFFLAVVAGICLFPSISKAANIIVGTGSDTSYLVLQSTNLGIRTYEVHYTYNSGTSQDGFTLLSQVLSADSFLTAGLVNFGSVLAPNYFVNSFTFSSITETSVSSSPYVPYWAHWVSGGEAGFPSASTVSAGTWSSGSGISSPYRFIAPGSWDALYYSDGSSLPSVAPIPEVSSTLLGVIGTLVIFRRRCNS